MTVPALQIEALEAGYDPGLPIVRGASLSVAKGEIVAVLVEGCERVVAPCAELLADERMAALYLGRHAGAQPATASTATDHTGQPTAAAGQEPV